MADVRAVLAVADGRFRACYEQALVARPLLEGSVRLRIVIDESGAVNDARVEQSSLEGDEVHTCLCDAARSLAFPRPTEPLTLVHTVMFRR
jgi:TonB family protein